MKTLRICATVLATVTLATAFSIAGSGSGNAQVPNPIICPMLWQPVCAIGKDGKRHTYANDCWTKRDGITHFRAGECK